MSTPTSPSLTFRKRVAGTGNVTPLRLFGGGRRGWMVVQKQDQAASWRGREDGRLAPAGEDASYVQDTTVGTSWPQQNGRLTLLPSRASCGKALLHSSQTRRPVLEGIQALLKMRRSVSASGLKKRPGYATVLIYLL